MNPVKIVFFDIDGTLLRLGHTAPSAKIHYALEQLHRQGILYYASSGRPPYILPDFHFDGWCCFNGGLCQKSDGTVLFSKVLDPQQVRTLVSNATKMGKKIVLAGAEDMGKNGIDPALEDYMAISKSNVPVDPEFEKRLDASIYQVMLGISQDQLDELLAGTTDLAGMAWYPTALDIVDKNTNKGEAILTVLEKLGIDRKNSLAFGDGHNDIGMLKAAGTGIAMDNALDEVKEIADAVCPSVDEDGVYEYLVAHQIIDPMPLEDFR